VWVLLSLIYFLSLSCISEKSENSHHAKIVNYNAFNEFLQMVWKHNFIGPFKLFFFIGNKHFGTKVRTMVRFFVPLWSESSLQKAFPTENFSKSKRLLSTFHLMIFACQVDIEPDWVRTFPQSGEFISSLFRCLNIIFLLFGNIY
jgi:hypothetical protein